KNFFSFDKHLTLGPFEVGLYSLFFHLPYGMAVEMSKCRSMSMDHPIIQRMLARFLNDRQALLRLKPRSRYDRFQSYPSMFVCRSLLQQFDLISHLMTRIPQDPDRSRPGPVIFRIQQLPQ